MGRDKTSPKTQSVAELQKIISKNNSTITALECRLEKSDEFSNLELIRIKNDFTQQLAQYKETSDRLTKINSSLENSVSSSEAKLSELIEMNAQQCTQLKNAIVSASKLTIDLESAASENSSIQQDVENLRTALQTKNALVSKTMRRNDQLEKELRAEQANSSKLQVLNQQVEDQQSTNSNLLRKIELQKNSGLTWEVQVKELNASLVGLQEQGDSVRLELNRNIEKNSILESQLDDRSEQVKKLEETAEELRVRLNEEGRKYEGETIISLREQVASLTEKISKLQSEGEGTQSELEVTKQTLSKERKRFILENRSLSRDIINLKRGQRGDEVTSAISMDNCDGSSGEVIKSISQGSILDVHELWDRVVQQKQEICHYKELCDNLKDSVESLDHLVKRKDSVVRYCLLLVGSVNPSILLENMTTKVDDRLVTAGFVGHRSDLTQFCSKDLTLKLAVEVNQRLQSVLESLILSMDRSD